MGNIAIVSCTSADLTPEQAAAIGVRLVPLKVSFGDDSYDTVIELIERGVLPEADRAGCALPQDLRGQPGPVRGGLP